MSVTKTVCYLIRPVTVATSIRYNDQTLLEPHMKACPPKARLKRSVTGRWKTGSQIDSRVDLFPVRRRIGKRIFCKVRALRHKTEIYGLDACNRKKRDKKQQEKHEERTGQQQTVAIGKVANYQSILPPIRHRPLAPTLAGTNKLGQNRISPVSCKKLYILDFSGQYLFVEQASRHDMCTSSRLEEACAYPHPFW